MAELVKTEDGRAYYDDGSVRHAPGTEKAGTYIERPPQAAPLITKENASQLAKRKHELRQQAVEEGLALGVAEAAGLDDIL